MVVAFVKADVVVNVPRKSRLPAAANGQGCNSAKSEPRLYPIITGFITCLREASKSIQNKVL